MRTENNYRSNLSFFVNSNLIFKNFELNPHELAISVDDTLFCQDLTSLCMLSSIQSSYLLEQKPVAFRSISGRDFCSFRNGSIFCFVWPLARCSLSLDALFLLCPLSILLHLIISSNLAFKSLPVSSSSQAQSSWYTILLVIEMH